VAEPLGPRFAKLWTASTTSALGSGLATIAAPLFLAAHTKNPLIVSATTGVAWLPCLLFALPGGVLVDRDATQDDPFPPQHGQRRQGQPIQHETQGYAP
jgi:hypothetical protein